VGIGGITNKTFKNTSNNFLYAFLLSFYEFYKISGGTNPIPGYGLGGRVNELKIYARMCWLKPVLW
jgi:hypothetical protein